MKSGTEYLVLECVCTLHLGAFVWPIFVHWESQESLPIPHSATLAHTITGMQWIKLVDSQFGTSRSLNAITCSQKSSPPSNNLSRSYDVEYLLWYPILSKLRFAFVASLSTMATKLSYLRPLCRWYLTNWVIPSIGRKALARKWDSQRYKCGSGVRIIEYSALPSCICEWCLPSLGHFWRPYIHCRWLPIVWKCGMIKPTLQIGALQDVIWSWWRWDRGLIRLITRAASHKRQNGTMVRSDTWISY